MIGFRIASYNCNSVRTATSKNVIHGLCGNCDVICLQELQITKQQLPILSELHDDFYAYGTAPVDMGEGMLRGRPHGGMAILWRKNLDSVITIQNFNDDRLIGFSVQDTGGSKILFISVYLPCDTAENEHIYADYIGKICDLIWGADTNEVCVIGDFNATPGKRFGNILTQMCSLNNFILSDVELLPPNTFSYISAAHAGSVSWLDHCMSTHAVHSKIRRISYPNVCIYDHLPMVIDTSICISATRVQVNTTEDNGNHCTADRIRWDKVDNVVKTHYMRLTDQLLSQVHLPLDIVRCKDAGCVQHIAMLKSLYVDIVSALRDAEAQCALRSNNRARPFTPIPGWNEYAKEHYDYARHIFNLWVFNGKPKFGYIYDEMIKSRARAKNAIRFCKRHMQMLCNDNLAENLSKNSTKHFWDEVRKTNAKKVPLASNIGSARGPSNVCNLWRDHYHQLFNCVDNDSLQSSVQHRIRNCQYSDAMQVGVEEVHTYVKNLKMGKSRGPDGLCAENIFFCSARIVVLLSLLFTAINVHGVMPENMITSQISPIVKNKCGNLSDKNNYRPICVATVISKIYEQSLLDRCKEYLQSTDNQFGFKPKHSTDQCIYVLKEIIDYYLSRDSPIFICFLDASKAFDRVNHFKLFDKLLKKSVPVFIVRILAYWYRNQTMAIRWGTYTSSSFRVTNSVRQGSLMSPLLYNFYTNDLSVQLSKHNAGCLIGSKIVNNLCYADDSNVFAPTTAGLQSLVDKCVTYADEHNIVFNVDKTQCVYIVPKKFKSTRFAPIKLNNCDVKVVEKVKYLGTWICEDNSDDCDIKTNMYAHYVRANTLVSKFHYCSVPVKAYLYNAYCGNFYGCALWREYRMSTFYSIKIAYNNAFRKLMNLPYWCSASGMFAFYGVCNFDSIIRRSCYSLMSRLLSSDNSIIRSIINNDLINRSRMWSRWREVLYTNTDV